MPTVPNVETGVVHGVDQDFLDLVCADQELLRAEFDAIIAQEWSSSPPSPDPPAASPGTGPGPPGHRLPRGDKASLRRPDSGADEWSRQRSPPRFAPIMIPRLNKWMDEGR